MSFFVRDGQFDVIAFAAPRVNIWPSVGVRALSTFCSEVGLKVGLFGGNNLSPCGIIPLSTTGGTLVVEDAQKRIHRVKGKSVVRVHSPLSIPDGFEGSRSEGVLPIETAEQLLKSGRMSWMPGCAILGTGNRALRFASR